MYFTGLPVPLEIPSDPICEVADAPNAFPCRRCLTDAEVGEVMLLVSYDPWSVESVYRQSGPVFVHERRCTPAAVDTLPDQQRRRLLSVRGYGASGMPTDIRVVPGSQAEDVLKEILSDHATAFVHVHNAGPGCFAVRVDRS